MTNIKRQLSLLFIDSSIDAEYKIKQIKLRIDAYKIAKEKESSNIAVNDDIIMKNPAKGVMTEIKNEASYVPQKKPALTEDEQEIFVNHLMTTKNHTMIRNMIFVLLGTDCRIGEVIGLRWDDVDFDSNVININHAVGYTKEDGKYFQYIKDPKSYAGKRSIPMLSEVRKALLNEKQKQEELGIVSPVLDDYSNFVFVSLKGRIYTRDNICI